MRYLQSQGWVIAAHRFRVGHTEIDLVARRGHLVAFVEVKARRGTAFGSPLEAVTGPKRRGVGEGARGGGGRRGGAPGGYRLDCLAVAGGEVGHPGEAVPPGGR